MRFWECEGQGEGLAGVDGGDVKLVRLCLVGVAALAEDPLMRAGVRRGMLSK